MERSYSRNARIITRKFYQYLLPMVLMVIAMQIGSLADAIVIGNFVGEAGLSASSLSLPVVFLVQFLGLGIATGAAILGANMLAKREVEKASKVMKLAVVLGLLTSIPFILVGIFLSGPIANLLAGNFAELAPLIQGYISAYLFSTPVFALGFLLCYFLPSDNHPTLGAAYFIIANLVHLGVEVLFTLFLPDDWKMFGAGVSLGIGLAVGFVVLIPYMKSKQRQVNFKTPFKGAFAFTKELSRAGSTAALTTLAMGVVATTVNLSATYFMSSPSEVALLAMLSNFVFLIDLFVTGVMQILPSVGSALYGEEDYYGLKAVLRRVLLISLIIAAALMVISMIFPQMFFAIFGVDLGSMEIEFGNLSLLHPLSIVRIFCASFLFYTLNKFVSIYYPSIVQNVPANVSVALKNVIIGPVMFFFLLKEFGVLGYAIGSVILEIVDLLGTYLYLYIAKKGFRKWQGTDLFLLPKTASLSEGLDISVPSKKEEISSVTQDIQKFALSLSKDETSSALLAVAAEEIIANIMTYGYKKDYHDPFIDVYLHAVDGRLIMRVRDDGIPFNPTVYRSDEEFDYSGIEVVRKIATKFDYLRILNTNNTVVEIAMKQS